MSDEQQPSYSEELDRALAELIQELDRAIAKLQESAIELALVVDAPTEANEVIRRAMESEA